MLLLISMTIPVFASANQVSATSGKQKLKALIVYYSWSNNTRTMAEFMQRHTGFDMEELDVVKPYIRDYEALLDQVREEEKRGYLPELKPLKSDLTAYDVIFVGSPLWIYTLSSPVMSFLSSNDLSGKVVIPFATRGTSAPDRLYAKFAELCPGSRLMTGFDITRGGFHDAQPALINWLDHTVNELEKIRFNSRID
jgi:flavodoxin